MSEWIWRSHHGIRYLTCALLRSWPHAFCGRHSHPHKPDLLAEYLDLPGERAVWANQVHGDGLAWAEQMDPSQAADALATQSPATSVWVKTADCVPILLASDRAVVAIHAGWRGTAAAIGPKVLAQLQERGILPEAIWAAIGPAISGSVYQVGREVAEQVVATLPASLSEQVLRPDPLPDKVRIDIRQVNALQMQAVGLPSEQISISPHCTWSEPESFFSYRRDPRPVSGAVQVQWSGIACF